MSATACGEANFPQRFFFLVSPEISFQPTECNSNHLFSEIFRNIYIPEKESRSDGEGWMMKSLHNLSGIAGKNANLRVRQVLKCSALIGPFKSTASKIPPELRFTCPRRPGAGAPDGPLIKTGCRLPAVLPGVR
ncbi:hypothetical protein CHARACLAT_028999 [Characodon lateralis]|uniref:Uncharacterized protein n=1 Tax=Characodon lateralis TaxID=208331 RepID=A0ABU7EN72_9TELE|nr:hypothetical protein [Characodon lateralis]